MAVTVPERILEPYPRFSLYNSPYPAHDDASGIDLYPDSNAGISPVAGVVRGVRTVGCPDREYAADRDHVIAIDVDRNWAAAVGIGGERPLIARILHVDPDVEPGDRVAPGDALGPMVRSGFFGRWVDNHVHLEFRDRDADPYRASGSRRLAADAAVEPVSWDGTGTVVEAGPTYVRLDGPSRSGSNGPFRALGSDRGVPLDGGLTHYAGGGAFLGDGFTPETWRNGDSAGSDGRTLSLLGQPIGTVDDRAGDGQEGCVEGGDGRTTAGWTDVTWRDVDVYANGERATGLSLFVTRRADLGIKVVKRDHDLSIGDRITVTIRSSNDPIRLGPGR
ncbi:hypothetical protein [Halopenitus persicus]|uniref:Peptidase family M23 n=1 Tax=Halopenitus persicus TaxID=1048396 RepID=A0A1H3EEQ1_9EURY|nr:hypothetical protein [Halopenitus persicus]SDX77186.1 hypothetical protein SAMN05216564_101409 [Halopenitus persicus]